jgi:hypothetical protein
MRLRCYDAQTHRADSDCVRQQQLYGLVYLPIRQWGTIYYKMYRALVVESTFKEVVGCEFFVFIAGEVSL